MIVLDASVALAWCFPDERSALADAVAEHLRTEQAFVPAIWPFEVSNALASAERRGRLEAGDRQRLADLLDALPVEVERVTLRQALASIADIARSGGLSVYDAAYVELASRLSLPLATLDQRLAAVAATEGVAPFARLAMG